MIVGHHHHLPVQQVFGGGGGDNDLADCGTEVLNFATISNIDVSTSRWFDEEARSE